MPLITLVTLEGSMTAYKLESLEPLKGLGL